MSYPPYRNYEGSYERDADRRRGRGDEDRELRQRGEREGRRFFRQDDEDEDRGFESEPRFGREERFGRGQLQDWEQPRRFGSRRGEWSQQQPRREGGGYFGEGGYPGGSYGEGRWGESRGESRRFGFDEGGGFGFDESRRSQQRFGSESAFGGERGYGSERGYGGSYGGAWEQQQQQRGQFAGRGPKNYRRSDQRIQEEVCDRLTSDPQVDASEIQVTVKDGEITLEGSVNERRMKRLAEDCAESVSGVNQVHNRLRVEEEGAGRSQGREQKEGQSSQSSTRQQSSRSSI
jgi:hypothetical protein